jgi:hypothetical protein
MAASAKGNTGSVRVFPGPRARPVPLRRREARGTAFRAERLRKIPSPSRTRNGFRRRPPTYGSGRCPAPWCHHSPRRPRHEILDPPRNGFAATFAATAERSPASSPCPPSRRTSGPGESPRGRPASAQDARVALPMRRPLRGVQARRAPTPHTAPTPIAGKGGHRANPEPLTQLAKKRSAAAQPGAYRARWETRAARRPVGRAHLSARYAPSDRGGSPSR